MICIRPATKDDVTDIMIVEENTFGVIGTETMATDETMVERIVLCNAEEPGWFLVAIFKGEVVGYMVLQPTNVTPDECTSWSAATDNGTLKSTFDNEGNNIYVVSLGVLSSAPCGTSELLVHASFVRWLHSRKSLYIFCSRMPGFATAQTKSGCSPEDYWRRKNPDGGPTDWMLREYWRMTGGVKPLRLLLNGFQADKESGGHGVLFAARDPLRALDAITERLYSAGVAAGKQSRSRPGKGASI